MTTIGIVGAKNGVGTTVTASMLFLRLRDTGHRVKFVTNGDGIAALGLPNSAVHTDELCQVINLDFTTFDDEKYDSEFDVIVQDGEYGDQNLIVTPGCYLALRRMVGLEIGKDASVRGVIHIDQQGRALTARDIENAGGKPVIASIPFDPAISRLVDAGLLYGRTPYTAIDSLIRIISHLNIPKMENLNNV